MEPVRKLNAVSAAAYAAAGTHTLKKLGVHHLSRSSLDQLLECTNKFHFKSRFKTAKTTMLLGNICHAVLEQIANVLIPWLEAKKDPLFETPEEFQTFLAEYRAFKDAELDKADIAGMLLQSAQNQLMDLAASQTEILYADGMTHQEFRNEILAAVETMAKSVTKEHYKWLLEYPVVASEAPVVYMPKEGAIPYLGYVDMLTIGPNGKYRIVDLKSTFSSNQNIWNSAMTKFQLWLYGKSLMQMGFCDYMPEVEIKRITIDTGSRRKVKPSVFKVTLDNGVLPDIESYDRKFQHMLSFADKMIADGIEVFAHSQYGCESCEYLPVCDQAVIPGDWERSSGGVECD